MKGNGSRFLIVSVLGRGGDGGYQTLTFNVKLLSRRLNEKLGDKDIRGQGKLVSAELSRYLASKGYNVTLAYLVTYSLIKSCGCEDDPSIETKILNLIDHTLGPTLQELKDMGVEVKPIPVEWLGVCDNVSWEMNPDSIRLRLILELEEFLSRFRDSKDLMIIADTSIGLNAYIALLLDVVRVVTVAEMMRRLTEGNLELYMLTQEPVLPRASVSNVNAFILDLPVVAFAKMPLSYRDIQQDLKVTRIVDDETCPELRDEVIEFNKASKFESTLKSTLTECLRLFNAVSNNAPLYVAHMLTGTQSASLENKLHSLWSRLYTLLRKILKHKKCGESKVSTCVSANGYDTLRDTIISLSLCEGLVKLAQKHIDKLESRQGFISLESLGRFSEHVYRDIEERLKADFALNRLLLSRDVRSLRRDLGIETGSELGDIRRNFFAHSGLARDVIDYQVIEDRIYVRYRESRLNEIRSWLELDVRSLV